MRTIWRILARTAFWSYERGSWPYDIMVLAILLFVLATPRHWFHDQFVTAKASPHMVQRVSTDSATHIIIYQLNASALPAAGAAITAPETEKRIHDVLSQSVPELAGQSFQIKTIQTVRDSAGQIQGYDVAVVAKGLR